ncbi:hypothetical protein Taro_009888 [Colocasia esculenta]|uniref:Uncharacterized protein n=1 Tax=Colocasia esculenta TaxID=4460 RepID=A0A843UBC2_COLES|nr:hypothetical protein [Colocasia esculenta]
MKKKFKRILKLAAQAFASSLPFLPPVSFSFPLLHSVPHPNPRFAISDLGFVSGGSKRRDLGEISVWWFGWSPQFFGFTCGCGAAIGPYVRDCETERFASEAYSLGSGLHVWLVALATSCCGNVPVRLVA